MRWRKISVAAAMAAAMTAGIVFTFAGTAAQAQGNLRVGMTANDVPLTWGQPDNGFEGYRFMGLLVYDALINWDLTSADKPSGLIPGLAESWEVDKADQTKWVFKLRRGVKFHDGSDFNADAVVFNMDRLFDEKSPQYSARMASLVNFRIPAYKSVRKIDDYTVEFTTQTPDAFWPYQICYILMASPKQWEATGKDWAKFALTPSGTGPWKLTALKAREFAELVPNKEYWDKALVPKLEKLTLIPMPDASARTAALLAGQVDWIEAPAPDAMKRIQSAGFSIASNVYPHIWSWHLNRVEGSPWNDIRVRKAANLAIDRKGVLELLGGYAVEATGHVVKGDPWYGSPSFEIKTDVEAAKKLLAEAGLGPDKPVKIKMLISASGSGQMLPLQMNEYMQQNLKAVGIDVDFEVVEWQALLDLWRAGGKSPQIKGAHGVNISYTTQDPYSAFTRLMRSDLAAPTGVNFGYYNDPEMDKLLNEAQLTFDAKARDEVLSKVHAKMVDDALFLWVVHDTAPRAISPKVKGFVQVRNWFQSLSTVTMDK
jgi:peptide/nickel transport system substrate-binding protein